MNREDKRKYPRRLVLIPARLAAGRDSSRFGLVRNISLAGAYFLTQESLAPGDDLEVTLHLTGDPAGPTRQVPATVVRIEELDPDTTDLWFFGVAVRFHEELADMKAEIEHLAERLASAE